MAGDLFIQDISSVELAVLTAAGATLTKKIQHSDRPWATYQNRLMEQLQPNTQNNRVNLPAHAYVTFGSGGSTSSTLNAYVSDPVNSQKLKDVLVKLSRPLGVVSNKAYLAGWPHDPPPGDSPQLPQIRLLSVIQNTGPVVIEFYLVDGIDLLTKYPTWERVPQHS